MIPRNKLDCGRIDADIIFEDRKDYIKAHRLPFLVYIIYGEVVKLYVKDTSDRIKC